MSANGAPKEFSSQVTIPRILSTSACVSGTRDFETKEFTFGTQSHVGAQYRNVSKMAMGHGRFVATSQARRTSAASYSTSEVFEMNDVRVLSTEELRRGLDANSGLHVLNVQTDPFFAGELIPGSRRIRLDGIEEGMQGLPKDAEIVTALRLRRHSLLGRGPAV
jgi:hypothetical protein